MAGAGPLSIALIGPYQRIASSRMVRGAVRSIREQAYVDAARTIGASPLPVRVRTSSRAPTRR